MVKDIYVNIPTPSVPNASELSQVALLIPAYKPDRRLPAMLHNLAERHPGPIVVVDDGCGPGFLDVFQQCSAINRVKVLRNAVNIGKGGALKNGINYILTAHPETIGIVTADADGQHAVDDIIAVARRFHDFPDALILGAREFGKNIPFRSKFGNTVSRHLYRMLLNLRLSDTQTGLRAIPLNLAKACLQIRSNRYEFETEQLRKL